MATCDEIHVTVPAGGPDRSSALAGLRPALINFLSGGFAEVRVDSIPSLHYGLS